MDFAPFGPLNPEQGRLIKGFTTNRDLPALKSDNSKYENHKQPPSAAESLL